MFNEQFFNELSWLGFLVVESVYLGLSPLNLMWVSCFPKFNGSILLVVNDVLVQQQHSVCICWKELNNFLEVVMGLSVYVPYRGDMGTTCLYGGLKNEQFLSQRLSSTIRANLGL